ncbi:MAG: hypothetical protein JNL54_16240 [Kineosporiaceae bacterium]|nr:hypothetical protein [Kineosporiaceae bacterium]
MSSSRRRRAHTENDGAWGHTLNDAWREQLDLVHGALSKLGDPLRDPLTTVSGAEFIDVLWRLPSQKRGRFLSDLKVPAARRPPASMEETIGASALARMSRWKDEQLTSALCFVMYDVLAGPVNEFAHSDTDASTVLTLAADCLHTLRTSSGVADGLLAAGLVAVLRDIAPGAVLAAWLRTGPLPGTDPAHGQAAVGAEIARILDAMPWDTVTPADATAGHAPVEMTSSDDQGSDDFTDAHAMAAAAYSAAADALAVALAQVQQQTLPDTAAVTAAMNDVQVMHTIVEQLTISTTEAAGLTAPEDGASLSDLAAAYREAAESLDPRRQQTQRLRSITLNDELASCRGPLNDLCGAAEDGDEIAYSVVTGLLRLADAQATRASLAELSALDTKIRPLLPAELAPLLLGLMLGQASIAAVAPLATAGPPAVEPVTVPEPAPLVAPAPAPLEEPAVIDAVIAVVEEPAIAVFDVPSELAPAEQLTGTTTRVDSASQTPIANSTSLGEDLDDEPEGDLDGDLDEDNTLRHLIRAAVDEHDTGLGYWLATAGGDTTLADTLKAATIAETLRGDTGEVASAAVEVIEALDSAELGRDRLAALAALAAAIRTTLVTGNPDAGVVLELLAVHVADQIGLSTLVNTIATAAQRGALAGGQLRALRDSSSITSELRQVQADAQAELNRSRTALLARATVMGTELFASHGTLGAMLTTVVADDRRQLNDVDATLASLDAANGVRRLVDDLDRKIRGNGSSARPLQGKARAKVLDWIEDALVPVRAWVRIARALQANSGDRHLPADLVAVKTAAAESAASIADELAALTADGGDHHSGVVLIKGAVDLAEHLLAGRAPNGSCEGCSVHEVLGRALLRAPQIALNTRLQPLDLDNLTVEALAAALGGTWDDVIAARIGSGDYGTARHAIAVATTGNPAVLQQQTQRLDELLGTARAGIDDRAKRLADRISQATRLGALNDDDQIRLTAALEAADPSTREDLNVVAAELTRIELELPVLATEAAAELAAKLQSLVEDGRVSVDEERRVQDRINAGDLAGADEILAAVEAGLDLPAPVTLELLTQFFPGGPTSLPDGLSREVITAVRTGDRAAGCDYSGLPDERRAAAADALDSWHTATVSQQRYQVGLTHLAGALRLAGIEAQREAQTPPAIRDVRGDRRFVDLSGVTVTGNAIVPAFGSLLEGRLRLLLVWGPQTPQTILNWVKQDDTQAPVFVCLFGTMSADARRKLADATASLPGKPVVVLDDAALAFLASQLDASITTTMQILLPFATTNPYVPQAEGNVPSEMFYGRATELSGLLSRGGTSLVYGGRQLGKSALLRAAQRRHTNNGTGIAVVVSTQPAQQAEEIWDLLRSALEGKGIRAPRRESRRDAYGAVVSAVEAWLEANPEQWLLVLFDECDNFFDHDAADGFKQTTRLRDLRNTTQQRFKPVFAGLHEVARFASLPNQPFAHLGKPTPIGPLAPAEAFRLVTEPMAALGIALDEIAWRVLAYCNYQPILLQLVCQHLVKHVYERRDEFTVLPVTITDDEFENVWKSPELVAEVSGKLRLTLDLDPRYGVVARVLGLAADEKPKILAMSTVQLREECENWWSAGFASATEDDFRALLIEMVTLGVLAQEGRNWALRSANVRRMLGTSEDILAKLVWADQATVPGPHVAGEARQQLANACVAPLTESQLGDVIGERNQLRIILGSRATGADLIGDLLVKAAKTFGRFELIKPGRHSVFVEALTTGDRGGKHRVVYSDITTVRGNQILVEIEEAQNLLPGDGVTRSAVLYLGVEQADIWLELLQPGRGRMAADSIVACRRLDRIGLERWSHEQHGQFTDPADLDRLLAQTGGWPMLIDYVARLCTANIGTSEALATLRTHLDGDLGQELLDTSGVTHGVLEPSYTALVEVGPGLLDRETDEAFEEIIAATSGQPDVTLAALIATGAVTREEEGRCSLERILAELWAARSTH